jgi:hypothetical protein
LSSNKRDGLLLDGARTISAEKWLYTCQELEYCVLDAENAALCLLEISPRTAIEPSNRVNAGSVERLLWFLQQSGYRHLARSKTVY